MVRTVGIVDIAREAGCSINTVSRALNDMPGVSAGAKARVLAAAERLHYTPSRVARSLLASSTKTLGLVVTDCTNPFYARAIRAVEDFAFARDYSVILCNSGEDYQREMRAIRMLLESRVDGILITPVQGPYEHIAELLDRRIPFVLVGRRFEMLDTPYVTSDNVGGARTAVSHLLSLGHRVVGHVTGRQEISSVAERLAGFCQALQEHGLPLDSALVVRGERDVEGGLACARQLLACRPRPTAIFAYNDLQALGVLRAARELRLRVPEELAVVGFDDIELSAFFEVPLTTVAQPTYELGRRAVEMLFQLMHDPLSAKDRQVILHPELIVRSSSALAVHST